nr:AAA family ATPase [uncultured Pseudomonas sp.]
MLETLSIANFKAFSGSQKIKLAPITLIYGPNSSGKSSIIHSIMLLKQSLTRPNVQGGLVSNGEFVDLGDYSSMVHGHELKRAISFGFSYLPNKKQSIAEYGFDVFGKNRRKEFELVYNYADGQVDYKGFSYLDSMSVKVSNESNSSVVFASTVKSTLLRAMEIEMAELIKLEKPSEIMTSKDKAAAADKAEGLRKRLPAKRLAASRTFIFGNGGYSAAYEYLINHPNANSKDANPKKVLDSVNFRSDLNYATPSMAVMEGRTSSSFSVDTFVQLNFAFSSLASDLKNKFGAITYLGPLRSHPSRFYAPKADQDESVGKQGENVAKFIYERPEMQDDINSWFAQFEVPYELSSESIGTDVTGPVICLQLKDKRTGVKVGPSDVGFGIGQMLPILVEGLVRDDSIICVEQPEIHLHPRLQAHLANFFVATCKSNQWIVETHSESLILRLQGMMSQGLVTPEQVAVLYVEPTSSGGEVSQIRMDSEGDFIDPWPEGFFEERLTEKFRGRR